MIILYVEVKMASVLGIGLGLGGVAEKLILLNL